MPTFFDVKPLASQLAHGQLLICSNQRLASRLQSAYAVYCQQHGHAVVDAPRVYALDGWVQHRWHQLLLQAHPVALDFTVLSSAQEQLLWEQIINASGLALLRPGATAQQAVSAYRTLVQWRHDISEASVRRLFDGDEDSTSFLQWAQEFEQRCVNENYLPAVKVTQCLHDLYQSGELDSNEAVILVGFESLSPLELALLQALGPLQHHHTQAGEAVVNTLACETTTQELCTAATWAKQQLKNKPEQTIAVVIPDLAQQRHRVQRIFQEVFDPDFSDPGSARGSLPFNLSAGYPLVEAPVINAALTALTLYLPSIESQQALNFLASPFYALTGEDEQQVSRLAARIYDRRQDRIEVTGFRQLAEKVSAQSTNGPWHFADLLQQQATLIRTHKRSCTPTQWGRLFAEMLAIIDWPGQRRLDSDEYQQVSQWQSVLEGLKLLDPIVGEISYSQAVTTLTGLLSRQLFQPKTADSSLQLLGTLEAAGLQFDQLWIMSMSEQHWPANPSPNPLLPYAMQRDADMPHATAQRELEFATNLIERFKASANNVVASYCEQHEGNPLKPSPLISAYPSVSLVDLLGKPLQSLVPLIEIRRRYMDSAKLELFDPGTAPEVNEDEVVRGGSSVFASQSACPFRAFARHRLQLQQLPAAEMGLNAADRGSLLHRALEIIWLKLKGREQLLALSSEDQLELCGSAAEYALNELDAKKPALIGPRFRSLEKQRLARLLVTWLDTEKERAEFTVKAVEARHSFRVAQLQLETRIDRMDQLSDGSLVIIDYKTGKHVDIHRWWGDRPEEPQLPLYHMLLAQDNDIAGIAFARVHIDGHKLLGVGDEQSPETKIRFNDKLKSATAVENWQQLQARWHQVLTALAESFIAGVADVDPKITTSTCNYCDLSSVCRVNYPVNSEDFNAAS